MANSFRAPIRITRREKEVSNAEFLNEFKERDTSVAFEPGFVTTLVKFDNVELGDVRFEVLVDEVAGVGVLLALDKRDRALDG